MIRNSKNKGLSSAGALALALLGFAGSPIFAATTSEIDLPADSTGVEIQSALDSLETGGEVVLAAGVYRIYQPIILRHDYLTLRGSGENTVLRLADNADCPVVMMGAPSQPVARTTTHLRLADLMVDGNRANQQRELWKTASDGSVLNNNGVDIWSVNDSVVENVVCCRCRSGGLVMAQAARIQVRNFAAFDNEYDGLACYFTEQSHFSDLRLHDNLAAGISLDLSFEHNVIENATLTHNDLGIFMRDSRDNVFQGLDIEDSRKHGVFIAQTGIGTSDGWKLEPGTECTGNAFVAPVVSNCGGYGILINDASCTNNRVSGPQFNNNGEGGFFQAGMKNPPPLAVVGP